MWGADHFGGEKFSLTTCLSYLQWCAKLIENWTS
jgi:hypothetical protein